MGVNRDNIRLWVQALRSGEWEQTKGALGRLEEDEGGEKRMKYCCLGVACEVAFRHGVTMTRRDSRHDRYATGNLDTWATTEGDVTFDGSYTILPWSVQDWLGFDTGSPAALAQPTPDLPVGTWDLTGLNDTYDYDFAAIADAIEATYLTEENLA